MEKANLNTVFKKLKIEINDEVVDFDLAISSNIYDASVGEQMMNFCVDKIRKKYKVKEQMYVLGRYIEGENKNSKILIKVSLELVPESEIAAKREELAVMKKFLTDMKVTGNPAIEYDYYPVQ